MIHEEKYHKKKLYRTITIISLILKLNYIIDLFETQGIETLNNFLFRIRLSNNKINNELTNNIQLNNIFNIIEKNSHELYHPKFKKLIEIILLQLKNNNSKIIIFTNYRITAEIIQQELEKKKLSSSKFIGQSSKIEKGFSQKKQIEILNKFKNGLINILVSTSIAEEGLNIPDVDLIIFFDPVYSDIRNIQRKGRTGRFKIGNVIIMITKGTLDEKIYWINYYNEKNKKNVIQKYLLEGEIEMKKNIKESIKEDKNIEVNTLKIVIDQRELRSDVVSNLYQLNINLDIQYLNVGDYIISENVGIERKTINDFIFSIIKKKNNIFTQLINLSRNYPNSILILEGNINDLKKYSIDQNSIIGSLLSIILDLKIHLIYSENEKQTAIFLKKIAEKEQIKQKRKIIIKGEKISKDSNEQKEILLCSIPGIGSKTAKLLLNKFKSIINIFTAKKEEIISIKGIGEKTFNSIQKIINEKYI